MNQKTKELIVQLNKDLKKFIQMYDLSDEQRRYLYTCEKNQASDYIRSRKEYINKTAEQLKNYYVQLGEIEYTNEMIECTATYIHLKGQQFMLEDKTFQIIEQVADNVEGKKIDWPSLLNGAEKAFHDSSKTPLQFLKSCYIMCLLALVERKEKGREDKTSPHAHASTKSIYEKYGIKTA